MSDASTSKGTDKPSAESLAEVPELTSPRFRRVPGRGHHANLSVVGIVRIDADLWPRFGSAEAVNDALRRIVEGEADNRR